MSRCRVRGVSDDRRLMSRCLFALSATGGLGFLIIVADTPAAAHGLGGRSDLPLPLGHVIWASVFILCATFLAIGRYWSKPWLRQAAINKKLLISQRKTLEGDTTAIPAKPLRLAVAIATRTTGLIVFGIVMFAALGGNPHPPVNLAPVAFYVIFWVGVSVLSACVGDVWRAFNPMVVLANAVDWLRVRTISGISKSDSRVSTSDTGLPRDRPLVGNHWWAAVTLFGFVWLELAYFKPSSPRAVAVFLITYVAVVTLASLIRGRSSISYVDGFGVLFGYFAAMGLWQRDINGRLRLCWPLSGLTAVSAVPGTQALVLVVIGATFFDSFSSGTSWALSDSQGWGLTADNTVGLLFTIGVVFLIYWVAIKSMSIITGDQEQELSNLFALSLVPICVAYTIAHYFSYLLFEGQRLLAHISDPFGYGWNLFGTATYQVNYTILPAAAIAWVQVVAIVVGHVFGVISAHDIAMERYSRDLAMRSQHPMLVAMIIFTIAGLLLLFSD